MKTAKILALLCGLTLCFTFAATEEADAGYYGGWNYYNSYGYYYTTYNYSPYRHHYCVYYPSYPRYVYYYNPYSGYWWGRFDLEGKPGQQYSLLAKEDQRAKLTDIPESAFPAPGEMPLVPESKDSDARVELPPTPPELKN